VIVSKTAARPRPAVHAKPIVVIGSSNTDMIIRLDRIPRPGETLLGGEFLTAAGGKGANQAVGRDGWGEDAVAGLKRDGINVKWVFTDPTAASGVALIFVAKGGENSIAVAGGANAKLSPADVRHAAAAISSAALLVAQLETPLSTVRAAAALAAKAGIPVILNPAPAQPLPDTLLKFVSILTPNETEAEVLTGIKVNDPAGAAKAAAYLRARGVRTVIITLGSRGAYLADVHGEQVVPGFKVKAVDTTAAGDVFNGALAVALAEGNRLPTAVRFANAAAALSVTRRGAQPSAPTRADIERFLATATPTRSSIRRAR
jgi:ribokinase